MCFQKYNNLAIDFDAIIVPTQLFIYPISYIFLR